MLIAITSPEFLPDEARALTALFDHGLDRLHVRKPGADEQKIAALLDRMDPTYYDRISLHDCFALQQRYGIGGLHLNGRNPELPSGFSGVVSRSCHSIEELWQWREKCDYLFLSPIFDSISKEGYSAHFSDAELVEAMHDGVIDRKVVALGGVSIERIGQVKRYGFGGVALLGDLWLKYHNADDLSEFLLHFDRLRREVEF